MVPRGFFHVLKVWMESQLSSQASKQVSNQPLNQPWILDDIYIYISIYILYCQLATVQSSSFYGLNRHRIHISPSAKRFLLFFFAQVHYHARCAASMELAGWLWFREQKMGIRGEFLIKHPHGPWSQWNVEIPGPKNHGFVERGCFLYERGMGQLVGQWDINQ